MSQTINSKKITHGRAMAVTEMASNARDRIACRANGKSARLSDEHQQRSRIGCRTIKGSINNLANEVTKR
ncbi:hypothetical protein OH492_27335 [Vibrio chagasii]|nr:hypothetical protein [Vibrio chagasii]